MDGEEMSMEWQPAIIVAAHGPLHPMIASIKKTVRCRPVHLIELPSSHIAAVRKHGCDSEKFYAVHDDDRPQEWPFSDSTLVLCEHGILTD